MMSSYNTDSSNPSEQRSEDNQFSELHSTQLIENATSFSGSDTIIKHAVTCFAAQVDYNYSRSVAKTVQQDT